MGLFRRRRSAASPSAEAIDAFWSAWPEFRTALAEAIDAGEPVPEAAAERVSALIRAVHPALGWETAPAPRPGPVGLEDLQASLDTDPGELMARLAGLDDPDSSADTTAAAGASYALTLRAGADDDARIAAERWARSAPPEPAWTFRPAVPTDHDALGRRLDWNGHELDLSHSSVELRADRGSGRLTAGVYHPDFMFLPDDEQQGVAEHVVMLALGEDDYVRTIGAVHPLVEKPLDPLPPTTIPAVAQQLGGTGGGGWVSVKGRIPLRGAVELLVRHPVQRRDFPVFTLLAHIVLPYSEADEEKLPFGAGAEALDAFTSRLNEVLGTDGALFAKQSGSGQQELFFYVDPESGVLPSLEAALRDWDQGRPALETRLDPEWRAFGMLSRPLRRNLP